MSERTSMDPYETRLAGLLRAHTETATRPIDPLATARMAIGTPSTGVLGRPWPTTVDRKLVRLLVAAALVMSLAVLVVVVGSQLRPDDPGRLVFVRSGDLYVAAGDGSGQTRIADGGADEIKLGYLSAGWSPDGRHIAAVRDAGGEFLTPAVDLMTADGAVVRTVALQAGCGPSVSWSPNSAEVAIATCPANVRRDAIDAVDSDIRLLVAGLDASADREIVLPPEWRSVASANPEVWTRSDLWAQWSPDGRWIALSAIVAGQGGHYVVAADGSGTRRIEELNKDMYRVDSFDWSHDGRSLAISGNLVGCAEDVCLGIVDSEGGPVTSTVRHPSAREPNLHGKLFWPEFSPGGHRVAVLGGLIDFTTEPQVADTSTLYAFDLATARFTELTSGMRTLIVDATGAAHPTGAVTGELVAPGTVHWTPDGRRLVYLVPETGGPPGWTISSIDAAGGRPSSVLVQDVSSFDLGPTR